MSKHIPIVKSVKYPEFKTINDLHLYIAAVYAQFYGLREAEMLKLLYDLGLNYQEIADRLSFFKSRQDVNQRVKKYAK